MLLLNHALRALVSENQVNLQGMRQTEKARHCSRWRMLMTLPKIGLPSCCTQYASPRSLTAVPLGSSLTDAPLSTARQTHSSAPEQQPNSSFET